MSCGKFSFTATPLCQPIYKSFTLASNQFRHCHSFIVLLICGTIVNLFYSRLQFVNSLAGVFLSDIYLIHGADCVVLTILIHLYLKLVYNCCLTVLGVIFCSTSLTLVSLAALKASGHPAKTLMSFTFVMAFRMLGGTCLSSGTLHYCVRITHIRQCPHRETCRTLRNTFHFSF